MSKVEIRESLIKATIKPILDTPKPDAPPPPQNPDTPYGIVIQNDVPAGGTNNEKPPESDNNR